VNATERIQDALVEHDLLLARYNRGAVERTMTRLMLLEGEVVDLIKEIDPSEVGQRAAQRARLERLLREINSRIDVTYAAALRVQTNELAGLIVAESKAARSIVNKAMKVPILNKGLGSNAALELLAETFIPGDTTGSPLAVKWREGARALKQRIAQGLGSAVDKGQHLSDMLRVIRGSRAVRYQDGVMFKSRRGAASLLNTAGAQLTNASRLATYQRNGDRIKGYQADAVLDGRTSKICHIRNGQAWHLDHSPFKNTGAGRFPGPPPWHYNCRTTLIPIFHDLESLQSTIEPRLHRIIQEEGDGFAFDGQPAPRLTFDQWLNRRSEAGQKQALGTGVWELWQTGQIKTGDLVNRVGTPLTLKELKLKAGVDDA